jgi:uncharacterized protein YjiS (DUF1127 family)
MNMAHAATYNVATASRSHGVFASIRQAFADYALYRRTLGELQELNDRELRDLGISRFSVRQIAYDSVYGA